jgi:hypothetical protein
LGRSKQIDSSTRYKIHYMLEKLEEVMAWKKAANLSRSIRRDGRVVGTRTPDLHRVNSKTADALPCTEEHLRISFDRRSDSHSAHRAASGRVCVLVQGSPGYGTKYVTIFCACRTVFRFFKSCLHR